MQPAAVASSRVTAAAREPGFGGHVRGALQGAGPVQWPYRGVHACLSPDGPPDSHFSRLCKLFPHKAALLPFWHRAHVRLHFPRWLRSLASRDSFPPGLACLSWRLRGKKKADSRRSELRGGWWIQAPANLPALLGFNIAPSVGLAPYY